MKDYAFGIDIGGTTVKMGLFSTKGEKIESWEIPTRKEESGAYILPDIAQAIKDKLAERSISMDNVEGIGIDVPGPILQDRIVNRCVNLGWGVMDVAKELGMLIDIDNIKVANDANAAALGEMWKGGGEGHTDLVMITLGTGVGGGVILNGKIVGGHFGAGGEIGHVLMNRFEEKPCACGKKGHLEQYTSATGIVRRAKEILAISDRPSTLRDLSEITAKDVFDQAQKWGRDRPGNCRLCRCRPRRRMRHDLMRGGSGDLCHRRRRFPGRRHPAEHGAQIFPLRRLPRFGGCTLCARDAGQ